MIGLGPKMGLRFAVATVALAAISGVLIFIALDSALLAPRGATSSARLFLAVTVAIPLLLMAVGQVALFRRIYLSPLKGLADKADRAALDSDVFDLSADVRDELGGLSGSLSRMTARLREDHDRIARQLSEITAQKKELEGAQEQLVRAGKLAMVGRLSAGIAHEIGTPLSAVLGYVDLVRDDMKKMQTVLDSAALTLPDALPSLNESIGFMDRMEREINRISRIIRELLDYSRPSQFDLHGMELAPVVNDVISMLKPQKGFRNIDFSVDLGEPTPGVLSDYDRLRQVLLNLLFNASDAMSGRGACTIACKSDGGMVALSVRDTGTGIPASELGKIFEPFYTTKVAGHGTGLGLAVSQRLVESMGGRIEVSSVLGKGSAFTVWLRAGTALDPAGR